MICVIDYGMGNLRSVSKALEKVGGKVWVTSQPEDLVKAEKVVLPGVGGFGDGAEELGRRGLFEPVRECLSQGKPFLGICLGMQLLFDESEENPGAKGFGFFRGKVQRFQSRSVKIPHMGWNEVKFSAPQKNDYFYFVHSYYPLPEEKTIVQGTCEYGAEEFAAFVAKEKIWATQFHPEKSQDAGLQILKKFVSL